MSFLFCIGISLVSLFPLYRWGNWSPETWSDCTQTENRKFRIQIQVFWLLAPYSFCYNLTVNVTLTWKSSENICLRSHVYRWRQEVWITWKSVENLCLINHQMSVRTCMGEQLSLTLSDLMGTAALQTPLSMEFSRQEYLNSLWFSSPGDFPNPGI